MANEVHMFSPEYEKGTTTHPEEPSGDDHPPIELQLEQEVKEAVKVYGTGKPRREIIRANIIHG